MNSVNDIIAVRRQIMSTCINCFFPYCSGNDLYLKTNLWNKMIPYSIIAKRTKNMQAIIQPIMFVTTFDFGEFEIMFNQSVSRFKNRIIKRDILPGTFSGATTKLIWKKNFLNKLPTT